MMSKRLAGICLTSILLLFATCFPGMQGRSMQAFITFTSTVGLSSLKSPLSAGALTDGWDVLFEHTPVAWTTALPPPAATILDATYVKINPRIATPFPCKRCPDYALEGGLWKFSLEKGIYRIYYPANGWRSLGSYSIIEDRISLFNDPYCHRDTGVYRWILENGTRSLTRLHDPCSQGLRAENLSDQPWISCEPPDVEAMISDHWQKPEGCHPAG